MAFSIRIYSLYNFYCFHRANLAAGIAFDAQVSDHFMFFMRLEKDGFGRAFLGTFGTADTKIIDLVFDHALAFARRAFSFDMSQVFFTEVS